MVHILRKWKLLIIIPVICGLSAATYLHFAPNDPAPTIVQVATPAPIEKVPFGFPVRLKIPKISVDAPLEHVGLTPEGDLDAPKGALSAGWYDHGPRPGEKGNAVIDGHYGPWRNGEKSVFDRLDTLQRGDTLYVEDERGTRLAFVVRESKIYGQNDSPPDVFISNDGKAHLNLITCNGDWQKAQKTYSNRLVVFTDMVDSSPTIK